MCLVSFDIFEAVPVCFTCSVTPVIVTSLRNKSKQFYHGTKKHCGPDLRPLLLGGVVAVVERELGLARVGERPPVLAAHARDLPPRILRRLGLVCRETGG